MTLNPNPMPLTQFYEPSNDSRWAGVVCVAMTLSCPTVQQPPFPLTSVDPSQNSNLLQTAQQHNNQSEPAGLWALDPDAIGWMLNNYDPNDSVNKPSSATYCYRTHTFPDFATANSNLLQALDQYNMVICALTSAGTNWVVVCGYNRDSTALYGFYIVDPSPGAQRPHVYAAITTDGSGYWNKIFTPVSAASHKWGNVLTFLQDDPQGGAGPNLPPRPIPAPGHQFPASATTLIDPAQVGQRAIAGMRANHLDQQPEYSNALATGTPGKPILVHWLDQGTSYYYLVALVAPGADPNGDPAKTPALAVVAVDALTGELMASYAASPAAPMLGISADDVRAQLSSRGFPPLDPRGSPELVPPSTINVTPLLVHSGSAGSSLFRPFCQAVSGAYIAYLNSPTGPVVGSLQPPVNYLLGR